MAATEVEIWVRTYAQTSSWALFDLGPRLPWEADRAIVLDMPNPSTLDMDEENDAAAVAGRTTSRPSSQQQERCQSCQSCETWRRRVVYLETVMEKAADLLMGREVKSWSWAYDVLAAWSSQQTAPRLPKGASALEQAQDLRARSDREKPVVR